MYFRRNDKAGLTPKRRKPVQGIALTLLMLAVLVALTFMFHRPQPLNVLDVTPATALDDTYRPIEETEVYGPEDTFFVSVALEGYRAGMEVYARWLYEGELITETLLDTADEGTGFAGFVLRNEAGAWPVGEYAVEIVYRDEVLGKAGFRVEP
jgi:hypothetical protein